MQTYDTDGRRRLTAWLAPGRAMGRTQGRVATKAKVGQSSVSLWVSGRARPEPHHRELLEIHFGIPADSWLTDDERSLVEQARAEVAAGEAA